MAHLGFVPLPEGIATLPPGAELGAELATVDPARVAPRETAVLLAATRRQLSHTEALHARALRECALADPDAPDGRSDDRGRHGAGEPRAVLGESRTRVEKALDVADDAFVRLPALGAAWAAGDLDADRVRVFGQWTRALCDEHAIAVTDTVLPEALLRPGAGLTLSTLIERISEVAAALDPTWAARVYDNAAAQQRVRARRTNAGTVNLSGLDLPLDEGTRSTAHIATLAARIKAGGHPAGIDTIRARVYLLLLSPRTAGFDDDALVAHAVATASGPSPAHDPHGDPGDVDDAPPEPEPQPDPQPGVGPVGPLPRQARIELRVALSTMLGLDDKPARMPGHGVLHAELARELVTSHHRGQWRVAVVDDAGDLVASLLTRRRPAGHVAGPPLAEGAPAPIVELHISEHDLAALRPHAHPAWAGVVRDLQEQLRCWQRTRAEDAAARQAEQAAERAAAQARHPYDPLESHETPGHDVLRRVAERRRARACEAMARFPSAALRRWIEQRDRSCTFPPCGATATRCEIDHSLAVVAGGITVSGNLRPACRHDHDAKTTGGWTVHQDRPGRFTWTSPTGNHYRARTPRIVPELPPPLPPEHQNRSDPLPTEYADHGPLWHNDPYPRSFDRGGPSTKMDDRHADDQSVDEPPF